MYRTHSIEIKKEDYKKADLILLEHWRNGDIDGISVTEQKRPDGIYSITFWFQLYVFSDLDIIKNKFQKNGITLL
jgi:hypothetical protein